jgi:hypothetical protein
MPLGYPILSAAMFSLSVAMLTLCALQAGAVNAESPATLPRAALGVLLTVVLAAGLTVGGLVGGVDSGLRLHSRGGWRPGFMQSARVLLQRLFRNQDGPGSKRPATNLFLPPGGAVEVSDHSFPGVVLITPDKPKTVIAMPSHAWTRTSPGIAPSKPLSIPFSGQYWMFRPPHDRPPQTSRVQQGDPLALAFRTTDHTPMYMEARQLLEHAISLACCRAIGIAISSVDRSPRTVELELVLIDTRFDARPSLGLGRAQVLARPSGDGRPSPAHETLEFAIPPNPPLHEFDQIKVVFHRDPLRQERSARISIQRFVLIPKGA